MGQLLMNFSHSKNNTKKNNNNNNKNNILSCDCSANLCGLDAMVEMWMEIVDHFCPHLPP